MKHIVCGLALLVLATSVIAQPTTKYPARPVRTPAPIVSTVQQKIAAGFQQPATLARLVALDSTVVASTPATFAVFLAADLEKWGKVLRYSSVKAE